MENLFNKILSHASAEEKATPAKTPGLRPLALMPRTVRLLPEVPRRWSAVEEQLVNAAPSGGDRLGAMAGPADRCSGSGKTSADALCDISRTAIYLTVEERSTPSWAAAGSSKLNSGSGSKRRTWLYSTSSVADRLSLTWNTRLSSECSTSGNPARALPRGDRQCRARPPRETVRSADPQPADLRAGLPDEAGRQEADRMKPKATAKSSIECRRPRLTPSGPCLLDAREAGHHSRRGRLDQRRGLLQPSQRGNSPPPGRHGRGRHHDRPRHAPARPLREAGELEAIGAAYLAELFEATYTPSAAGPTWRPSPRPRSSAPSSARRRESSRTPTATTTRWKSPATRQSGSWPSRPPGPGRSQRPATCSRRRSKASWSPGTTSSSGSLQASRATTTTSADFSRMSWQSSRQGRAWANRPSPRDLPTLRRARPARPVHHARNVRSRTGDANLVVAGRGRPAANSHGQSHTGGSPRPRGRQRRPARRVHAPRGPKQDDDRRHSLGGPRGCGKSTRSTCSWSITSPGYNRPIPAQRYLQIGA